MHELLEIAEQGTPWSPALRLQATPARPLMYSWESLAEVRLYSDAAKTQLAERRVLTYTGDDALTSTPSTRRVTAPDKHARCPYTGGVLTSVTEARDHLPSYSQMRWR